MDTPATAGDAVAVTAARDVLVQLNKAIRVFRMYDRGNDLVSRFVDEMHKRLEVFLGEYGDLDVAVRPAAFEYRGESIKSQGLDELALSLFRQGMTGLQLTRDLDRAALVTFLDLLTIGLTGGDDANDDLVTLLWRAELSGVTYASVLGFEEEGGEDEDEVTPDDVREAILEQAREELAEDGGPDVFVRHGDLMQQQEALQALPEDVARFIEPLGKEGSDDLHLFVLEIVGEALLADVSREGLTAAEVRRLLELVLQALLESGNIEHLAQFAGFQRYLLDPAANPGFAYADTVREFVLSSLTDGQVRSLVGRLPGGPEAHAEHLTLFLTTLGRGLKETLASLADTARTDGAKDLFEGILLELCRVDPGFLVQRLGSAKGGTATRTLKLLARLDPETARKALVRKLETADPPTQASVASVLTTAPELYDAAVRDALLELARGGGRIGAVAVETFRRMRDATVVDTLWQWIEDKEFETWEPSLMQSVAKAATTLTPGDRAVDWAAGVLSKKKLLGRRTLTELQVTAARALAASSAPRAAEVLEAHAGSRNERVRTACESSLRELRTRSRGGTTPPVEQR